MIWASDDVGIPFKNQGMDWDGCDCYGLVALVYKEQYNVMLPTIDGYLNAFNKQENKTLFLLANFNEDKINQLFYDANLPLWGSLRPQVLLWLIAKFTTCSYF